MQTRHRRIIDAVELHRLLAPRDLIEPLRRAFAADIVAPRRTQHAIATDGQAGSLLLKPAWRRGGMLGVKIATVFPDNERRDLPAVHGTYVVMSAETGVPLAMIDGTALTAIRTAAVSALAAGLLAPRRGGTLLMVGTGALAPLFVQAHASTHALQRILIWGRSSTKAADLVRRLQRAGLPVAVATDLEAAARVADTVCCATLSREPLIRGAWLKDGMHLDLTGSFRPDMREADDDAIAAGGLAVDTDVAFEESGDLIEPLRAGRVDRATTPDLAALVRGSAPHSGRITVFKSVGTAVADLAAAEEVLRRAADAGPA